MSWIIAAAVFLATPVLVEPPPLATIETTATTEAPATRGTAVQIDPTVPPPVEWSTDSWAGRCVGMEVLLWRHSPGWDVLRMSRIAYRESRCDPTAKNKRSSATGLLQILSSHCRWLAEQMGEPCSAARLREPEYNIRAGAVLWQEQGYGAWAL